MFQTRPEASPVLREGIPYWIFWFLLSLILLLLLFIFLRDKDLRRRLSLVLAGAKKRMLVKRLEIRLRRQKRRKTIIFREIGRTIWAGRIGTERFGPSFARLGRLETQIAARHVVLQGINDQLAGVSGQMDGLGKNRGVAAEGKSGEDERRLKHRMKDLQRKAKAERGRIRQRSREKAGEYERLGVLADENRIAHPDLHDFYIRLDQANRAILSAMDKIEKLA
jgi:hypothetical protein